MLHLHLGREANNCWYCLESRPHASSIWPSSPTTWNSNFSPQTSLRFSKNSSRVLSKHKVVPSRPRSSNKSYFFCLPFSINHDLCLDESLRFAHKSLKRRPHTLHLSSKFARTSSSLPRYPCCAASLPSNYFRSPFCILPPSTCPTLWPISVFDWMLHTLQSAQKQKPYSKLEYRKSITALLTRKIFPFAVAYFIPLWLLGRWLFANCPQTAHKEKQHFVSRQSFSHLSLTFYLYFHIELTLGRGDCQTITGELTSSLRYVMKERIVVMITTNDTFFN